jgi:hypothetical protein
MTITPNELFRILSAPDGTFLAVRDANPAFAIHGTSPGDVAEKAARALAFYESVS